MILPVEDVAQINIRGRGISNEKEIACIKTSEASFNTSRSTGLQVFRESWNTVILLMISKYSVFSADAPCFHHVQICVELVMMNNLYWRRGHTMDTAHYHIIWIAATIYADLLQCLELLATFKEQEDRTWNNSSNSNTGSSTEAAEYW